MKLAVMGYGTIGSGVVEVIRRNSLKLEKKAGEEIEVKYVLDLRDFPGDPMEECIVHDYKTIVNDDEVKVVVETMGGVEPAYTFVKEMLEAKKHVTTSNKALVAAKGAELLEIAKANNVNFQFEASVGGGIPIIRNINSCLTADILEEITGILNGTTNYMLTKMANEGADFDEVLKDAQEKGYAEKDPTADIEGYDPCRKIAILTSIVSGKTVDFEDIHCEGITGISADDFKYAKKLNRSIKLLASSRQIGSNYVAMVAPYMLDSNHPLYSVNDVFNAVFVRGNVLGDAMFYGSGAGSLPTASAVVADVVEMTKNKDKHLEIEWSGEKLQLLDYKNTESRFFVRTDKSLEDVRKVFGNVEIVDGVIPNEIGFITSHTKESEFEEKAEKLGIINRIRIN